MTKFDVRAGPGIRLQIQAVPVPTSSDFRTRCRLDEPVTMTAAILEENSEAPALRPRFLMLPTISIRDRGLFQGTPTRTRSADPIRYYVSFFLVVAVEDKPVHSLACAQDWVQKENHGGKTSR